MPFDPSSISGLQLRLETLGLSGADGDTPASWLDSTSNAIVGTNHGAIYRTGAFFGQPGFAFNGADAYIDLGTPAALELYDAFTIFAVIRTSTAGRSLAVAKDFSPGDKGYGLGISPAGSLYFDFASNIWDAPSGPSLIDDAPHILRLSYAAGSWKAAVDGVQLIDFAWGGPLVDPGERWNLGRCSDPGDPRYYDGSISAVLVYDSELAATDSRNVESYLFDTYIPPPSVPVPYTVQVGPSGETVIIRYRMLDGITPAKVIGATGGITIDVNGVVITPSTLSWCNTSPSLASDWLFGTLAVDIKYSQIVDNESSTGFATPSGTWATIPSILQDPGGEYFYRTLVGLTYTRSNSANASATYTFTDLTPGPGILLHSLWDFIDSNRTVDAVYTARDGSGTLLGTPAHLDQTLVIGPDNYDLKFADLNCNILLEYNLAAGQDTIIVTVTNGAGSGYLVCDALIVKSTPVPIAVPGDTVTIDIPANSVTVSDLPTPRDVVGRAVTFAVDNDIAPYDESRPRTMIAGYNKEPSGTNGLALMASNRGYSIGGWSGDGFGGTVVIDQLTGEIISMTGTIAAKLWDTLGDVGTGIPTIGDGDSFRLEFDYTGTFDATAKSGQTFFCEGNASVTKDAVGPLSDGYVNLGGTRWRLTATYHTAPWLPLSTRAPNFFLNFGITRGTSFLINAPVHNISFFDRYTPVGDTRYAHPTLHDRFGGTGMMWRFMDALNTNGSQTTGVSDYWPETAHFRSPSNKAVLQPVITRIRGFVRDPVTDPDHVFNWSQNPPGSFYAIVVIEVDSTADMIDGQVWTPSPVPPDFSPAAGGLNPLVHVEQGTGFVISPTEILFLVGYGGGPDGDSMPASIAVGADWVPDPGTATLWSFHGTDAPVILAKCAAEVGMRPYFTLQYLLTDAGAVEWAHLAMDHFPPGTKIRFELFNEVWNSSIVQGAWNALTINLNKQNADNPDAQPLTFRNAFDIYIWKSNHFRMVIKAEFAAAGRVDDLVWLVSGLAADTGKTGNIASWGSIQSPPVAVDFDEFPIDTYQNLDGGPFAISTNAGGGLAAVCDRLGVGGSIDLLSLCSVSGSREALTNLHKGILDSFGFSHVKIVSYEGGWDALGGSGTTENTPAQWAQVILRHPRMYHLTLAYLQYLDRIGYGFFCRYTADYFGGLGQRVWCDYSTPIQANGTGDALTENLNPYDVGSLVSQEGGAMRTWALGVTSPTTTTAGPTTTTTAGPTTTTTAGPTTTTTAGPTTTTTVHPTTTTTVHPTTTTTSGPTTTTTAGPTTTTTRAPAPSDSPILSWNDLLSLTPSPYRLRARSIRVQDYIVTVERPAHDTLIDSPGGTGDVTRSIGVVSFSGEINLEMEGMFTPLTQVTTTTPNPHI